MLVNGLSKEFSQDLGFLESVLKIGQFPRIERGKNLTLARQEIAEGRPAYLRAVKDSQALMVYLEPTKNGFVKASVVPALHFVTSHGLGRHIGTSDRLESFAEILKSGFDSPTADLNAILMTSRHEDERWLSGYPLEKIDAYYGHAYMTKKNSQDRGEVVGDSLRVVLWSGFHARNRVRVREGGIKENITIVGNTPTNYVEGVVVTAPGSDWNQRVRFYQRLYKDRGLIAPIEIHDVNGNYLRVE